MFEVALLSTKRYESRLRNRKTPSQFRVVRGPRPLDSLPFEVPDCIRIEPHIQISTPIKKVQKIISNKRRYISIDLRPPINGEAGKSSNKAKLNIGLMHRPQATKVLAQKVGTSIITSEVRHQESDSFATDLCFRRWNCGETTLNQAKLIISTNKSD